jgi:hypothetical protein
LPRSGQHVATNFLLEWLFTTAYSLLIFVISLSLFIKSLHPMAQRAVASARTTLLEAKECCYLSEQLLYLVHSRLDLSAIISFHSHWMSFIAYAIAFAGPTAAIAASAFTLAGISIDCAAATFQSMEVGYQLSAYLVTSPASFGIGPATHQVHRRTFQGDSEDGTR